MDNKIEILFSLSSFNFEFFRFNEFTGLLQEYLQISQTISIYFQAVIEIIPSFIFY